jgi:NADH:ubiquinone oxidoreductase subunit 2 (subunit N)
MPPLAGFWAKTTILAGAFDVAAASNEGASTAAVANAATIAPMTLSQIWPIGLTVVAGANLLVAAFYYVRLLDVIYFRLPLAMLRGRRGQAIGPVVAVCAALIVGVGVLCAL